QMPGRSPLLGVASLAFLFGREAPARKIGASGLNHPSGSKIDARTMEGFEMKTIYKALTCLLLVSFLAAGLAAVPRLKSASAQTVDGAELLTVVAQKVDEIPIIDGDFSEWAEVSGKLVGATTWKAVYTDDELAMYIQWADHGANIDARGTWNWDAGAQSWWRTGWEGENWPRSEWFTISFDMTSDVSSNPMTTTGCGSLCHETSEGSAGRHHQTGAVGSYVDIWILIAKHGFGHVFNEDLAWLPGVTSVSQEGDLAFNSSDPKDTRAVIDGRLTFVGYAEDKVIASQDDPKFVRGTLADQYCQRCHEQLQVPGDPLKVDLTYGDPGDILYSENWDEAHTVPLYMETDLENWIDAMILTQAEIDAGEAVLIADLSEAEVGEAWNKYAALNAVVPHLILQEPSGDMADVSLAATWYNGAWTIELKRKLVTGSDYDVQFDDLTRDYPFAITLTANPRVQGGVGNSWTLRFEQ
ncbi:MAG: hypothetical protein OZ934_04740, partial [Anaerolineae bacterium]|nr:hypothetical protein [Anaerolineae bacterium]